MAIEKPLTDIALKVRKYRLLRRIAVSAVLVCLTVVAFSLAGEPAWFQLIVAVVLVVGYCGIDCLMARRESETASDTANFILIALALSLLWAAGILGIGYLLSR